MELQVRLPVLPAQCYSPSQDHGFENRRRLSTSRQPLQESTGNIQHPHMAWYAQHLEALSSVPPSIPPLVPPVLRTQSLGPEYGPTAYARSQQRQEHHVHGRRRLQGVNPLMPLTSHTFQNYRKKQSGKQDQKWPDELEGPFLDALLLIPRMGRKKYNMKQTLYGRNMLIGEYLWIAYCHSLPPGAEPDPQMLRERKKVSSHIQVLKNFFINHRCFHFLFWPKQDDKEKDTIETVSLKNNPVLIALSEGRFPEERPNYEYFAQILALNDQVQFRPKRCWIFVSHKDVVVGEDRTGYLPLTGSKLSESEYPHLGLNLERDTWAKEEQQFFKGALLHEFTKKLVQVESSSVREVTKKWDSAFPDLHQRLKAITSTTTDARCDFLHLHATLELKEKRRFPSGSSFSSWVELNIEKPRLFNHRWKVETRLVRPPELSYSQEDSVPETVYEEHKEFTLKYQHRPGCDSSRNDSRGQCDCLSQRCRRDGVTVPFPVPFPADAWAQTLTNCAEYPAHPFIDSKRHERERGAVGKTEDDDNGPSKSRRRTRQPTQMDLVPRIAMMQEIWSCPPTSPSEEGSGDSANQRWTRRAVILWTFETVHSIQLKNNKKELVTAQSGSTNWRFLTILDPASEYHQRHAVISGRRASADGYRDTPTSFGCASRTTSRNAVPSPSPTSYQQPLSASMRDSFSSSWDQTAGLGSISGSAAQAAYGAHFMQQAMPSHGAACQSSYGLLDSFGSHTDLATPPPSASLATSFSQSFDTVSTNPDMLPGYMTSHAAVTTAGMDAGSHSLGGTLSAVTDPFLAHMSSTYGATTQDGMHGWDSHGLGGSIDSTASWSSGYSGSSVAHGHNGLINWTGSHLQTMPSRRGSEQQQQHHNRHHQTQPRQDHRQSLISVTAGLDEQDPWTPATSANTPGEESTTTITRVDSLDQQHNNIAASTKEEEASQDWVHIQAPSTTASASDLSQDWEEVPVLPKIEDLDSCPSLTSVGEGQHREEQHSLLLESPVDVGGDVAPQGVVVKGLKRARSENFGGEEEYRSQRPRG